MNKDLPIWLIKPQTFSHFMYALGFIQLTVQSLSIQPCGVSFCTFVSWYQQDTLTTHWHYIFLHHSLLPRIPSHITSTHLSLPKRWPPSPQLSKAARIRLNLHSRNCFQAESQVIITLTLFLFSQGSQSYADCCLMFENHCFKFYPTIINYIEQLGLVPKLSNRLLRRGNPLYLPFDTWNLL